MLTYVIPKMQGPDTSCLNYKAVNEPFVDIAEFSNGKILVDMKYHSAGREGAIDKAYLRLEVAKKLISVADSLPNGYRLKIYDAWRPYEVQKSLFDEHYYSVARLDENRGKSDAQLREIATKFVSYPDRTRTYSYVHSSGGAVDLTLTDKWGLELDMGCEFDDFSDAAALDAFENHEGTDACRNRRILYQAMTDAGFTGYSAEWWHYDFGDIFWAAYTGEAVKYESVYSLEAVLNSASNEPTEQYDIFISYRRGSGEVMARLVYELLKNRKYNVFFDHKSLSTGEYDEKLMNTIKRCKDFIVIFSKDCFVVEGDKGLYYMKELKQALESNASSNTNILPLIIDDYVEPTEEMIQKLYDPDTVKKMIGFHGKKIQVDGIDGKIDEICGSKQFLKSSPRLSESEVEIICDDFVDLIGKKGYSNILSDEKKLSVIRSAIDALGDKYTAPILKSTLSTLSSGVFNVRESFNYNIMIRQGFDFSKVSIPSDKYFELYEKLEYRKIFRTDRPKSGEPFWVSFATGLTELDDELRDEKFFFSENFMIDKEDMDKLVALDDDMKRQFFCLVMKFKIRINKGQRLDPVEIIIDDSGVFARYDMPEIDSEVIDVEISFYMPQKYDNSFFFACISEPTYSPKINFTFKEDDFRVEMIPFLTRSLSTKDTRYFDGECELSIENEWIMPISGAIFLIDKI